jgi:hypothetical protein
VRLADYFYESLELEIEFEPGEFDKDAFLKDIKPSKEHKTYRFVYGSKEYPGEQHAHADVHFTDKGNVKVRLLYAVSKDRIPQDQPHSMEDCARWLRKFFKATTVVVATQGAFEFGERYIPVIPLPFPLLSSNKVLAGCSVTGVAVGFPEDADLVSAIVQVSHHGVSVSAWAVTLSRTNRFDAFRMAKRFASDAKKLVREVANERESSTGK